MNIVDLLGWLAGALVLTAFCLKTMLPLRCVAIASNVAFIAYGLATSALPIAVLHFALLPMNMLRLWEMRALADKVKSACTESPCLAALVPHGQIRQVSAGTVLFREGDSAKAVYLILEGHVSIVGRNGAVGPGGLLGERGILSQGRRHLEGALCDSDVSLASISEDKFWEVFYCNPEFAAQLVRLIVSRGYERDQLPPLGGPPHRCSFSAPPRSPRQFPAECQSSQRTRPIITIG